MYKINCYDSFFYMCEAEFEKFPGGDLKSWEVAIQEAIKKMFPHKQWYNVTHVSIFNELLSGKTPTEVCQLVWNDVEKNLVLEGKNSLNEKIETANQKTNTPEKHENFALDNKINIEIREAMRLRGFELIDTKAGKLSFRRIDDNKNMGDTAGWIFQYDNWHEVRKSLIYIPLWEDAELTKQVDFLIHLTEEERCARESQNKHEHESLDTLLKEVSNKNSESKVLCKEEGKKNDISLCL